MAKEEKKSKPKLDHPVVELESPRYALNVDARNIEIRKLQEIADLIWLHESFEEEERNVRIVRALELYENLKPSGSAEGMLAAQMIGTHSAAMDCLRRAAIPEQSFEGRNIALTQA